MVAISRLIIGGILVLIGLLLIGASFFNLGSVIAGFLVLIFGIIILLNKKEDEIEQRKDMKGGKKWQRK